MTIDVGGTISGTVVKIADYGAIVRLDGGKTGLVHISEIAEAYVRDVHDYLSENDQVRVKVVGINNKGRYELSMKQCDGANAPKAQEQQLAPAADVARAASGRSGPTNNAADAQPASFEDRLSRFMKDSEQHQHDLKRNMEAKRGRR